MQAERIADLAADRAQRVEREQRILRDEAHGSTAQPPQDALAGADHLRTADTDAAGHRASAQPQQGPRGDALARPGLADDRDALPRLDPERDPVHDLDPVERDPQAIDDQRAHRTPRRRPPRTVVAIVVSTIASPGNTVSHQALAR
ncbi:hypothetical protein ACH61_03240 [Rathayibacter tanaceti]|uniref:Uncharacterized protein n=1 Tax=Rathayibacter tanaceti TaxID=1671680 RepID=A0A166GZL9_9MICO|nr:hypothetical protein ACH61_03240 [Rathayibacter tanaceti]